MGEHRVGERGVGSGSGGASGALVLVGTPIGNLDDLSPRAAAALATADAIGCEDTRRTGRLLAHLGVAAPKLIVVNEHTEREVAPRIVERVARGERVVLVSDAGMPGVSDPGEALVAAVLAAGLAVDVVPGPTASSTALVLSGLPTGRVAFEGFLPRKGAGRAERLGVIAAERRTTVLYEAPHRLARTLADLATACGDVRRVAVARELTKLHEEVWRGTLGEAAARAATSEPRGEHVIVVEGAPLPAEASDDELRAALQQARAAGSSTRDAADEVAQRLGVSRKRAYGLAVER